LKLLKPEIQLRYPQVSKNSCGYRIDKIKSESDLQKIIAGSEGTLGIIISAKLRTFCVPKEKLLMILSYKIMKNALSEVPEILGLGPSAVEIIDHNVAKHIKARIPRKTGCLLFVEFDENLSKSKKTILKLTSGKIIKIVKDKRKIKRWWNFRNSALSFSLRSISKKETMPSVIEDAAVPVEKLPVLLNVISKLASKYKIKTIIYGHAGNGNLHIRPILKRGNKHLIKKVAVEFFSKVIAMGGTITGEHGDGLARSEFVKLQYGSEVYSVFQKIKKEFDPQNILNPDKIITRKTMITKNLLLYP
jgi:glycolate dehydrogenase FAD-linked subunit